MLNFSAFGQKDISRSFDAGEIERIEIFADEIFRINIKTSEENEILLESHSEGEYYNDINLDVETFQEKIIFTSQYREILQSGYDKLSAHKVFSFEITLTVPRGLDVYIRSNIAAVIASGDYNRLGVELQSGSCTLTAFTGDATINTYRGDIFVETNDAVITAQSGNGKVEVPADLQGNYKMELRSINGDIKVLKN